MKENSCSLCVVHVAPSLGQGYTELCRTLDYATVDAEEQCIVVCYILHN